MNFATKMAMVGRSMNGEDNGNGGYGENRGGAIGYSGGMENANFGEARFRDRRGRQHYNNGRYAPMRRAAAYEDADELIEEAEESRRRAGMSMGMARGEDYAVEDKIGFEPGRKHMEHGKSINIPMHQKDGMDKETAEEWVSSMENEDGSKGEHWTLEQVEKELHQRGMHYDSIEFWAALNAEYSDRCKVYRKYGVNELDFYMDVVEAAWMNDKDAVDDKVAMYYRCMVKKK